MWRSRVGQRTAVCRDKDARAIVCSEFVLVAQGNHGHPSANLATELPTLVDFGRHVRFHVQIYLQRQQ
jgi:hypothetical protein